MSVKKDASGNRKVELELELAATPEQVWQAIATGPGISSWFVPTEVEERVEGAVKFHLGPGMDSAGVVTAWEPPHRFAYEEREWSPNAPPLATECVVETRSGDLCIFRMVHSLFTSSEEWDDQLEGFEVGWQPFFQVLRLYLAHFFGQPVASLRLMGGFAGTEAEAWSALTAMLDLEDAAPGQHRETPTGVPQLAGRVERTGESKHPQEILFRIDAPAPGVALLGAHAWAGQTHVMVSLYLFGEQASAAARREEPAWQAWMSEHFPSAAPPGEAAG